MQNEHIAVRCKGLTLSSGAAVCMSASHASYCAHTACNSQERQVACSAQLAPVRGSDQPKLQH